MDLDSIVDVFSEAYNIDVLDDLPDTGDPHSFKEVMASPEHQLWEDTCKEEFESLKELHVSTLIPPTDVPSNHKVLCGKWVLLVKRNKEGKPIWYKARYIFWGCGQVPGCDYNHTTSPTAHLKSFCILLHLAGLLDWDIWHSLLNKDKFQFMEQPEGFKEPGKEDWV